MKRVVAGMDVSKSKLDVHLDGKDRTLPNDRDGFRAIANWFRTAKVERVVLEATGQLAKTDRVDARMLAAFGAAFGNLPQTQPRGAFLDRLGDMLVAGEKVVDQRGVEGNPVRGCRSRVGEGTARPHRRQGQGNRSLRPRHRGADRRGCRPCRELSDPSIGPRHRPGDRGADLLF